MVQYMEWLKAFLFGIVEGITEWLPISSTGHMILLNEFVKLDVSDAFYKMFEVVIQLGAILAVVVLFWNQIWPLKRNHGRHGGASVTIDRDIIRLWCKIVVACIPAAVVGLKWNDLFEELFYNYQSVAVALIVFGVFARGIFTSGKTTTEHAQRELHTYAEQHETSLADYPDALVQLYARNPDARDFVRDYPKKKDLTPTIDLSGLAGSETVPLLLQWDERWGYREYNESIIGLAGCGPTCLSMVTIYLTGDTTKDPLWMCQFAEAHQFNVPGSGSKWALISEGGRMLGLDVTQIPLDKDRIYRNLDVGNPIIVVVGPGDFTTDGHFLVLTGRSGDKVTLNDPNSPTNSAKSWDYDTLAGQIQALWVLRRAG